MIVIMLIGHLIQKGDSEEEMEKKLLESLARSTKAWAASRKAAKEVSDLPCMRANSESPIISTTANAESLIVTTANAESPIIATTANAESPIIATTANSESPIIATTHDMGLLS